MNALRFSQRVAAVQPSPTLAVSAKAAELRAAGQDIIGLGAGQPDFDTPEHIKEAAIRAIRDGRTGYTAVDGTPELKAAVQAKFKRDQGLDFALDQILVSVGGKQSFYNLCQALLDPGDEVVIPAPYWVSYPDMVRLAEGDPVFIPTDMAQNFKITSEQLERAITASTRLVVLNSPSNPSGRAYSKAELTALGEVLRFHEDVLIATDDMYEHILWTEAGFVNILDACPDLYERTIVMNGVSKAYAMTGWRIGYIGGPASLVKKMKIIQSQSTSNPCSIAQAAAAEALNGDQACIQPMLTAFKTRHDYLYQALNALPGVACAPSDGTFYSFPSFQGAIERLDGVNNDLDLAAYLLDAVGIAVVPGSAFGIEGCLRISFATGMDELAAAIQRFEKALGG